MSWTENPALAHPRAVAAAATCGTRIYAVGGNDQNSNVVGTAEAYDPASKMWSSAPAMPTPRVQLAAASTTGMVHAMGGMSASYTTLATHEIYNTTKNMWSAAPPMPTARGALAAVTGSDGLVYAIGGSASDGITLTTVEAYDATNSRWVAKAHMNTARMALAAVATPDGSIYTLGGIGSSGDPVNTVEVLKNGASTWSTTTALPQAMSWLTAATGPNGVILVIGGMVKQPDGSLPYLPIVYSFDPAAASIGWTKHAPVPTARAGMATVTGPDGLAYAIGGISCPAQEIVGTVEAYSYDKCDYILYQMSQITQQIVALEAAEAEVPPQQRAALATELTTLRGKLSPLESALKICRGG